LQDALSIKDKNETQTWASIGVLTTFEYGDYSMVIVIIVFY